MRSFKDGDDDPRRAVAGPGLSRHPDLVVDRSALDRIIAAGGFITAPTGSAPDGNAILIPKDDVDTAMDAAQCIGCGACVAACPNALGVALHRGQDHPPRPPAPGPAGAVRTAPCGWCGRWISKGFGGCTLYGECQEACPKEISIDTITRMNRDFLRGSLTAGRAAVAESD